MRIEFQICGLLGSWSCSNEAQTNDEIHGTFKSSPNIRNLIVRLQTIAYEDGRDQV